LLRPVSVALTILLAGCRSEMYDQPRYEPLEPSTFFENGASARQLVAGTVPRFAPGEVPKGADPARFLTGMERGQPVTDPPLPVDRTVLDRGQQRYRIFCTPCHGQLGGGRGIVVRRGFTAPPDFAIDRLRQEPLGHFVDVITNGHGVMYSYAARVPPRDRWAIAAYIRVLQLSQHAEVSKLPEEDKKQLEDFVP
jgi:mono/diheme cytochrome c family protein